MTLDPAAAADVLRGGAEDAPRVFLVLGSGLGGLADAVEDRTEIPFEEVPGLPGSAVSGHAGRFVRGRLEGGPVLIQSGRLHAYEGHEMEVVAAPVRIAAAVGVEIAILTNAAGGIRRDLGPGSVLLLEDQLNFTFRNPLVGSVAEDEPRFPDMRAPFDPELQKRALAAARDHGIRLLRGTYGGVTGPSFETPAEIRMLARMGVDVVGMSTVPEVLAARAAGLRVLGFSLVTNPAAGLKAGRLSHREVVETAGRTGGTLEVLVRTVLASIFGDGAEGRNP